MNLHQMHTGPLAVNTYLVPVSENGVIIVDSANCAFSCDEDSLLHYLKSKKLNPVAIVLTHGHFDHVAGLCSLKKAFPDIPIAIHEADSNMIGTNSADLQGRALSQMGFLDFLPFVSELPEATVFLEDKKNLAEIFAKFDFPEEIKKSLNDWKIIHTPGHTEGSICLYNESSLTLISGDTLFYHSWGRTDLISGDEYKIHKSLSKIIELCDENTRVFPGHDYTGFTLMENFLN